MAEIQRAASLSDRPVAVVTGGGSGLGRACVQQFASRGVRVVALDLNVNSLQTETNDFIESFVADVSSEKDVEAIARHTAQKYGRIDYLINCAGIACRTPVYDSATNTSHSLEQFTKVLQVNTVGTFNVIRLLVPIMAKNQPDSDGQRGVIVNTSSVLGLDGASGFAAYSASKSAIAGMTLPLAREFGPLGIRVVAVAPGFCDTPMLQSLPDPIKQAYFARMEVLSLQPKRMVRPQEFAQLVQAIIDNRMINAELIRLDAGVRIS